jgi:hypothetical protein
VINFLGTLLIAWIALELARDDAGTLPLAWQKRTMTP